jgi:hypothetical protein
MNIQSSHLTQVEMIDINLRFKKNICVKKFTIFTTIKHGFWLLEHICNQIVNKIV